jgi:hypothetical protein
VRTSKLTFICIVTSIFVLAIAVGIFVAEGVLHTGRRPLLAADQRQAVEMANLNASDLTDISIAAIERGSLGELGTFGPEKTLAMPSSYRTG